MTDSQVWTKNPPTAPGWYWYSEKSSIDAVLVEHDRYDGSALLGGMHSRDYAEPIPSDAWPGQWFGPIQPPALPIEIKT